MSAGSGGVNLQVVATCFEDAGLRLTKAYEVPMGARVCKATEVAVPMLPEAASATASAASATASAVPPKPAPKLPEAALGATPKPQPIVNTAVVYASIYVGRVPSSMTNVELQAQFRTEAPVERFPRKGFGFAKILVLDS